MKIEFGDDTFDTERRLMGELQGYTLRLTIDGEETDVQFVGFDGDSGDYAYRLWDDEAGEGVGEVLLVDPMNLDAVHVY